MEVQERLEESQTGEMEGLAGETPAEEAVSTPAPAPAFLHIAYSVEFFIALIAIFTIWSQVGGQGHLDLLPWHIKLSGTMALAWCCVRFTAALAEHPGGWSRRTVSWFAGIILISVAMAGITYYYHLHESPDESDGDETSTTVSLPRWRT